MEDSINKFFQQEKEFDKIVDKIFSIAHTETDDSTRNEKILAEVAKIKRAYLGAHYDSITDALTGCFNKKHIREMFHHQYSVAKRNSQYFSLVVMDVDYLKYINDNYGHQKGDDVLKNIVRVVSRAVREEDLIFRYGGDEFVLFCIHNNKTGIKTITKRIKEELSTLNIIKNFTICVSMGCVTIKTEKTKNASYTTLFNDADQSLYHNKHRRKPPGFLNKV